MFSPIDLQRRFAVLRREDCIPLRNEMRFEKFDVQGLVVDDQDHRRGFHVRLSSAGFSICNALSPDESADFLRKGARVYRLADEAAVRYAR